VWSSGQNSCLQIQRSGYDSRRYQILWVVVGLEWGQLSLVSTTEELLERKNSGSGLENRDYGRMDLSRWQRGTLYLQKLALTSPTSGCRSVGIVLSRTQATEFSFFVVRSFFMSWIIHYHLTSGDTRTKKVEYHCSRLLNMSSHITHCNWSTVRNPLAIEGLTVLSMRITLLSPRDREHDSDLSLFFFFCL
jgi:hypothetical protein